MLLLLPLLVAMGAYLNVKAAFVYLFYALGHNDGYLHIHALDVVVKGHAECGHTARRLGAPARYSEVDEALLVAGRAALQSQGCLWWHVRDDELYAKVRYISAQLLKTHGIDNFSET